MTAPIARRGIRAWRAWEDAPSLRDIALAVFGPSRRRRGETRYSLYLGGGRVVAVIHRRRTA